MIPFTTDQLKLLLKILEIYIPIAAPLIDDLELEQTEDIKHSIEQEISTSDTSKTTENSN